MSAAISSQSLSDAQERRPSQLDYPSWLVSSSTATNGDEIFVINVFQRLYTVCIGTHPSCTCTEPERPCQHMVNVYIFILHVPLDARCWQTGFSQDEVNALLQGYRQQRSLKRKELAGSNGQSQSAVIYHKQSASQSIPEARQPLAAVTNTNTTSGKAVKTTKLATAQRKNAANSKGTQKSARPQFRMRATASDLQGMELPVLMTLLDGALAKHPRAGRTIVEKFRTTVYHALEEQNIRFALNALAHKFPDVANAITDVKRWEAQWPLQFTEQVEEAWRACETLNSLGCDNDEDPLKYRVIDEIRALVDNIEKRIDSTENIASLQNAAEAILRIASTMLMAPEPGVDPYLRDDVQGIVTGPLVRIIKKLLDDDGAMEIVLLGLESLSEECEECDIQDFAQVMIDRFWDQ